MHAGPRTPWDTVAADDEHHAAAGDEATAAGVFVDELVFSSRIGLEHKDELERLLFFNGNQARVVDGVAFVVQQFGIPRIRSEAGSLRIALASGRESQTLFVLDRGELGDDLVGVVVYLRDADALVALFVAVHEEYAIAGQRGERNLTLRILDELKAIGRRVKGVRELRVFLGRRTPARLTLG